MLLLKRVFVCGLLVSPLVSAAECESDQTTLLQLKSSVKHAHRRLETERQDQPVNDSAINASANWTDYLSAGIGLPPPIGNDVLKRLGLTLIALSKSTKNGQPVNDSAINASANWTDYLSAGIGLPPPIGNPDLKALGLTLLQEANSKQTIELFAGLVQKMVRDDPPDDPAAAASWVLNTTGFNVSANTKWTDYYRSPLPPPIGNPALKALSSLLQKLTRDDPPDDPAAAAAWVMNNTGFNVSANTKWTDYYRTPLPPPVGNPVLKQLASLLQRVRDDPPDDPAEAAAWVMNTTGFNVSANTKWTDYYRSPLPPPVGNSVLKQLASLLQKVRDDPPEDPAEAAAWVMNTTGFNVSANTKWTDYYRTPLPPPVGNPTLKALTSLLQKVSDDPPDDPAEAAAWVMNTTGFNVSENTRWTDYRSPLPPPIGNPALKALASLLQKLVRDDPPDDPAAAAGWVLNTTGFNVSANTRWTDYYRTPLPPPIGNPTLKALSFSQVLAKASNDTPWQWYTPPLPPPTGDDSLPYTPEGDMSSLLQKNDTATNWTERWTNYLPPYDRESYPPLEPEVVEPSLMQKNDTATNWTERWTNYLPPYDRESYPPLEPEVVEPSLMQKNDTATNWTERWTNYLPPYDRESYPPLEPEVVEPSLMQKNDTATNWTERWTNYLPPYDRESYPPLEPEEVEPTLIQEEAQ